MSDVSGAFGWYKGVEELADPPPARFDGSLFGLSEPGLELCKHHLDRVEVGTVGRREAEMGTSGASHYQASIT
jgi:hypothetical protein